MVFRKEFMIFVVLDTMAPRSTILEENHASHNRRTVVPLCLAVEPEEMDTTVVPTAGRA